MNPPFWIGDDGIRDQLFARDCTELGRCHRIGAPASLRGLHQGAVWLDFLIAARLLGGDTSAQRTGVFVLLALSAATSFVVVWRWLSPPLAFPAAVLFVAALSFDTYPSLLTNASVVPFPAVLAAAGLLCFALSGRQRFLVLSAFAVGVGINVHVATLSLVPPLLVLAVLSRPRPWRPLVGSLAVLVGVYHLTSSAALRANAIGFVDRAGLALPLAGGLAVVAVAALLGARFRRLTWNARAWIAGVVLILPFGLATLWLGVVEQHHFAFFYLHPILAPAAVLVAAILCLPFEAVARWFRAVAWIPTAAMLAALTYLAVYETRHAAFAAPRVSPHWTMAESEAIAARAASLGWTFEDLAFRVQGNSCRELVVGMSAVAPPPRGGPRDDARQLRVVRPGIEGLVARADGEDIVRLGATPVALVSEIDSWLRPRSLRACRAPLDPAHPPLCASANPAPSDSLAPERFLFISRSYPEIHGVDLPKPYTTSYEFPLIPAAGAGREMAIVDPGLSGCAWQFTRVEGVEIDGSLPAQRVRMRSLDGSPGLLVVERPFGISACAGNDFDYRYPPCLLETRAGDPTPDAAGLR